MRVLVVWEPVLETDWGTPGAGLTAMVGDARAVHFFDRERRLSAAMGGPGAVPRLAGTSKVGFQMKDVIWDIALVYPPGARWGGPATTLVAPVVKYRDELNAALGAD